MAKRWSRFTHGQPWQQDDLDSARAAIRERSVWCRNKKTKGVHPTENRAYYSGRDGDLCDAAVAHWLGTLDRHNGNLICGFLPRILAATALLSGIETEKVDAATLAQRIADADRYGNWTDTRIRQFALLLKGATVRTRQPGSPPPFDAESGEMMLDATLLYVAQKLVSSERCPRQTPDAVRDLLSATFRNSKLSDTVEAFETVAHDLGLGAPEQPDLPLSASTALRHWICPDIARFLDDYPSGDPDAASGSTKADVQLIRDTFAAANGEDSPSAVLIHGREEGGKKMVAGEFLHFHTRLDSRNARVFEKSTDLSLPIFVEQCPYRDRWDMTLRVCAFLEAIDRNPASIHQTAHQIEDRVRELDLKERTRGAQQLMLERVRALHAANPALFVFLDVEDPERSRFSRALHETDILPLLDILQETNPHSIFLVTSSELDDQNWPLSTDRVRFHKASSLGMEDWCWYLAKDQTMVELANDFAAPHRREESWNRKHGIPGDLLAVMAQSFELSVGDEAALTRLDETVRSTIDRMPDTPEASDAIGRFADARRHIYGNYVDLLHKLDLLPLAALLAVVRYDHDGIVESSLTACLRHMDAGPTGLPCMTDPQLKEWIRKTLKRLGGRTMISAQVDTRPDPEERDKGEGAKESVYFFSRVVALNLLEALQDHQSHAALVRKAHHALAKRASERAVWKRINRPHINRFLDPMDHRRDAQAAMHLMAAAADTDLGDAWTSASKEPVRLIEKDVFSTTAPLPAEIAARYIYHTLLRDGIDSGFRLTMQMDLDDLRLKQFLLLILAPGRIHPWSARDLRTAKTLSGFELPTSVPDWLERAIGKEQVCKCLLSIALAAYHAQTPKVVWRVYAIYDDYWRTRFLKDGRPHIPTSLRATHGRMIAAVIDAALAIGRMPGDEAEDALSTSADADDGLAKITSERPAGLSGIIAWGEAERNTFVDACGIADGDPYRTSCKDTMRSFLRVDARLCDAAWLIGSATEEYRNKYETLIDREREYHVRDQRSGPIVRSGRSGRRYIRYLLGEISLPAPPSARSFSTLDARQEAARIISANIVRLNNHAGAERVGVLLDKARVLASQGAFNDAVMHIMTARNQRDETPVGPTTRAELLSMEASIWLLQDEAGILEEEARLPAFADVQRAISEIEKLDKSYDLLPTRLVRHFLEGRTFLCQPRRVDADIGRAKKAFGDARKLAEQLGSEKSLDLAHAWIEHADNLPPH